MGTKFLTLLVITTTILMANVALTKENEVIVAVIIASDQDANTLKLNANNLNLIYWRKQLFWPQGMQIKPVNLQSQNPLRMQFSHAVLGSTPETQIDYWNGQYFNGILPPYSVNSEEAVLRYVSNTKGAIGYINACNMDERVQGLLWLMPNGEIVKNKPAAMNCTQ
jgi:hypothetical protein